MGSKGAGANGGLAIGLGFLALLGLLAAVAVSSEKGEGKKYLLQRIDTEVQQAKEFLRRP